MTQAAASLPLGARDRILSSAYERFARHGVRAVGVDEVNRRAELAKATLYRYSSA